MSILKLNQSLFYTKTYSLSNLLKISVILENSIWISNKLQFIISLWLLYTCADPSGSKKKKFTRTINYGLLLFFIHYLLYRKNVFLWKNDNKIVFRVVVRFGKSNLKPQRLITSFLTKFISQMGECLKSNYASEV